MGLWIWTTREDTSLLAVFLSLLSVQIGFTSGSLKASACTRHAIGTNNLKFIFSDFLNELGWKNYLNYSCSTRKDHIIVVHYAFIWNHLESRNFVLRLMILNLILLKFLNNLKWINDLNQSYSTRRCLKLSSSFFYLNSFRVPNMHYNIL